MSLSANGLISKACVVLLVRNGISDKEPSLSEPVHVLKCFSIVHSLPWSGCGAHVVHVWWCLLSRSCCRNHKMKKAGGQHWMRLNGDFKQPHKQPLWNNLWASDMTCRRQPGHWEGFKCLLMSSSDPQLCCWMPRKTWSNSVTFSSPSDYSFTLRRAACGSLCNVI